MRDILSNHVSLTTWWGAVIIVASVVGGSVVCVIIAVFAWFFYRRKKHRLRFPDTFQDIDGKLNYTFTLLCPSLSD